MPQTIGWMRGILERRGITWTGPDVPDDTPLREHRLGGSAERLPVASSIGLLDLRQLLPLTGNPFLQQRRIDLRLARLADHPPVPPLGPLGEQRPPLQRRAEDMPAGGTAPAVDWRNRFGANWITTVRDQDPCESCWAFAGTALVEAMLKIENAYWARLSEGDLHDGAGSKCADGNNLGTVSSFLSANGLADPGCWPYHTDDAPYAPTPDRNGRSVRMPALTFIGDIGQQKTWIDATGPLATWFDVWHDFDGYTGGYVYHRSTDPSNYERGGHFMLVAGYDDSQQAWICKNSWGSNWGAGGYVLVGYGEAGIDQYAKAGLAGLNPDPWTKRRMHNGNLYESGNGSLHRNLEAAGATGGAVTHHWREGGPPWDWNVASKFGSDAAACPTITGTTYNRNIEVVYLTTGGRLHHWWTPGGTSNWADGGVFGPADCEGIPGFVQGDYGAPGNFEVVVKVSGGKLAHLWRLNGAPWTWTEDVRFGDNIALSGATLVQGSFLMACHGNLECVAVLTDGQM